MVSTGNGIAILEQGLALGGGALQNFGINSNTSANGFIKCLYKKHSSPAGAKPPTRHKKLKNKKAGLDEDSSDDNQF